MPRQGFGLNTLQRSFLCCWATGVDPGVLLQWQGIYKGHVGTWAAGQVSPYSSRAIICTSPTWGALLLFSISFSAADLPFSQQPVSCFSQVWGQEKWIQWI